MTFAALWTLAALLPTHSIVARLDVVTEKPLYLAWVGPALLLGDLAGRARRRAGGIVWVGVAAVLALSGVACARRVAVWQDPRALWTDAVKKAPRSARAWNNLGQAQAVAGDTPRARAAFQQALRLDPDDVTARRNLARLSADSPWY